MPNLQQSHQVFFKSGLSISRQAAHLFFFQTRIMGWIGSWPLFLVWSRSHWLLGDRCSSRSVSLLNWICLELWSLRPRVWNEIWPKNKRTSMCQPKISLCASHVTSRQTSVTSSGTGSRSSWRPSLMWQYPGVSCPVAPFMDHRWNSRYVKKHIWWYDMYVKWSSDVQWLIINPPLSSRGSSFICSEGPDMHWTYTLHQPQVPSRWDIAGDLFVLNQPRSSPKLLERAR